MDSRFITARASWMEDSFLMVTTLVVIHWPTFTLQILDLEPWPRTGNNTNCGEIARNRYDFRVKTTSS